MRSGENRRGLTEGAILTGVFLALVGGVVITAGHAESGGSKDSEKSVHAPISPSSTCKAKHLTDVVLRVVDFNSSDFAHGSLFSDPVDKVPNMKLERDNNAKVTHMELRFTPGNSLAQPNTVRALTDIENHFEMRVDTNDGKVFVSPHEVVTGHYFKDVKNPNTELVEVGTIDLPC